MGNLLSCGWLSETAGMGHRPPRRGPVGVTLLLLPTYQPPLPFLTGTLPNIMRNAIVNCAEMVTYDIIKEKLLQYHLFTGEALGSGQTAPPTPATAGRGPGTANSGHHPEVPGL